jgi:CRISPR/Cas system-associated exonuclease Cas4 (RecB family)
MSSLNNKYEDLLTYLKKEKLLQKESKPIPIGEVSKESTDNSIVSLKDIHSDVKFERYIKSSKGFDVHKFEALMRSKLIDEHKRRQSYERPFISVTELISCSRKVYYDRMKYEIDLNKLYSFSYLYLINKIGTEIHNIIQDLSNNESEKSIISEKFKVKGRIDDLRDNFLIEYKSIDIDKFKNTYLDIHYHQGVIYSYILNTEYNYKIDTITIVYIIRNLKRIIPFDVPVNHELGLKFLKRARVIKTCLVDKVVPDPIGADKEQCKWCLYKKYCKEDGNNITQKIEKSSKPKDVSPVFLL